MTYTVKKKTYCVSVPLKKNVKIQAKQENLCASRWHSLYNDFKAIPEEL